MGGVPGEAKANTRARTVSGTKSERLGLLRNSEMAKHENWVIFPQRSFSLDVSRKLYRGEWESSERCPNTISLLN